MRTPGLVCVLALAACAHAPRSSVPAPQVIAPTRVAELAPSEPLAPIALDANDGTALDLKELSIDVSIHGPIAETIVHARFENPFSREMEGRFRLLLPPRSSIARLAMKMGGAWREAEAAETSAAREVYDEIIHRRRDPLLVEQPRSREIAARIAPIFAHETKEIILRYTSEIATDRPMVIPLRGLPAIESLHVSVVDGATEPVGIATHDEKPKADVRYRPHALDTARSGDITATRVRASVESEPEPLERAVYLVDTSASADLDAAEALLRVLPKGDVIAYDQTAARVTDVKARGALGFADLRVGLELATSQHPKRIVILGGGTTEGANVPGVERIDVLGTTALVDARVLRPLAKNGVVIEDASLVDPQAIVQRLTHRVNDEERIVFAKSQSKAESSAPKDDAIEHAYAASRVGELVARGTANGWTESTKKEVIALARAQRLATPFTSLIVLENDRDSDLLHIREGIAKAPPPPKPGSHVTKAPVVRVGATMVSGRFPPEIIQRIVRQHAGQFRACYNDGLRRDPQLAGRVVIKFIIGLDGHVIAAADGGSEIKDGQAIGCMAQAFASILFPEPVGGIITVAYPFVFSKDLDIPEPPPMPLGTNHQRRYSPFEEAFAEPPEPWTEEYKLMRVKPAHVPHSPIGFIALGESLEARGDRDRAARAYASLAELWPERSELLRAAAVRLDRLRAGDPLAIAFLRRAVVERPDQPSGHHLLGLVLLRAGDRAGARAAFRAGADRRYELRYASVLDLFRADLELLEPSSKPLTRVSLAWETDTSDLDVVLVTDKDERSAGMTVSWAADGFGPEVLDATNEATKVRVALRRRGMGGDVTGTVHVIKRDERGDVTVEPRSFAIMNEGSSLDLGRL